MTKAKKLTWYNTSYRPISDLTASIFLGQGQIQDALLHLVVRSPSIYNTSSAFHGLGSFEEN